MIYILVCILYCFYMLQVLLFISKSFVSIFHIIFYIVCLILMITCEH